MAAAQILGVLDLNQRVASSASAVAEMVSSRLDEWRKARSPSQFRAMELEVAGVAREFADEVVEHLLREILSDPEFVVPARLAARSGLGKLRNGGGREVTVTLLGGRKVRVVADYLRPDLRGRPGPRRGSGRRGKGGAGVYPALAALGIHFGATPALVAEVVRQVADSDSVRAGRAALARRGIDLEYKQTLRIVNAFGARAVEQRDQWLLDVLEGRVQVPGGLAGKRVVVAADGGRVRERVPLRGRRKATGHHGFDTPWIEPKLFTIYVIDAKGKVDATVRPTYDGTLDDADTACTMLVAYLKALGAADAEHLTVVADGAKWIWDRALLIACGGEDGERQGFTPCGDTTCQPGQYCNDSRFGDCQPGCTSDVNCALNQSCRDPDFFNVGVCVNVAAPAGAACGNGTCETGEDAASCASDCSGAPARDPTCDGYAQYAQECGLDASLAAAIRQSCRDLDADTRRGLIACNASESCEELMSCSRVECFEDAQCPADRSDCVLPPEVMDPLADVPFTCR